MHFANKFRRFSNIRWREWRKAEKWKSRERAESLHHVTGEKYFSTVWKKEELREEYFRVVFEPPQPFFHLTFATSFRHFCVNVCQEEYRLPCPSFFSTHNHPPTLFLTTPFSLKWSLAAQQSVWCCCCRCLLLLFGAQRGMHMVYIRLSSTHTRYYLQPNSHTRTHNAPKHTQTLENRANSLGAYLDTKLQWNKY